LNTDLQAAVFHLPSSIRSPHARVVKWQTRTFEGRMPQGMGVQVPPRALLFLSYDYLDAAVDAVGVGVGVGICCI
jgi:hypothetical protein